MEISWNLKLLMEILYISWNLVDAPGKFSKFAHLLNFVLRS